MVYIGKLDPEQVISVVYYDGGQEKYYVKRFQIEEDTVVNRNYSFISESKGSEMKLFTLDYLPRLEVEVKSKSGEVSVDVVLLADFIAVKGYKARGKRLVNKTLKSMKLLEPLLYEPPHKEEGKDDETDENTPLDNEEKIEDHSENKSDTSDSSDKNDKEDPDNDQSQMELF
jgi:topoisomerase-4 subunit A